MARKKRKKKRESSDSSLAFHNHQELGLWILSGYFDDVKEWCEELKRLHPSGVFLEKGYLIQEIPESVLKSDEDGIFVVLSTMLANDVVYRIRNKKQVNSRDPRERYFRWTMLDENSYKIIAQMCD